MLKKICKICGKEFSVYQYRLNTANYCSYTCAGKRLVTSVIRKCRYCGKEFDIHPSQFKYYKGAGKYCSLECTHAGLTKDIVKDKYQRTPRRKKDKDWRISIKTRDNYTCQMCGLEDKYIHAHHIKKRSTNPELKYDLSNGISLCNSCHTFVHNNKSKKEQLNDIINRLRP